MIFHFNRILFYWIIVEQFISSFFNPMQFLYANYIAPSAALDIGIEQSTKNEIYKRIDPPFEDLFDPAEEYILTILLVPWMKMIEEDREIYGKVIYKKSVLNCLTVT